MKNQNWNTFWSKKHWKICFMEPIMIQKLPLTLRRDTSGTCMVGIVHVSSFLAVQWHYGVQRGLVFGFHEILGQFEAIMGLNLPKNYKMTILWLKISLIMTHNHSISWIQTEVLLFTSKCQLNTINAKYQIPKSWDFSYILRNNPNSQ